MLEYTLALTANEAAAAARLPLKQVHRIIDSGLLEGAVATRCGTRRFDGLGLVALKLAHITADVLKPEARRRAIRNLIEAPDEPTIRHQAVTVELGGIEADLRSGLRDLASAKAMVASDPDILNGTPCFAGTRIAVHDIADMLANGDVPVAIAEAFPVLDLPRISLASVFAAAYPRRGRAASLPWRAKPPTSSRQSRLEDLPPPA